MQLEPGSAEAWFAYARSDLALAKTPPSDEILKDSLCFHAQQAVEKSIKAVLVQLGIAFPKVHSIERLIDLLPASVARTSELIASAQMTAFATTFRYPGVQEPVSDEQHVEALRLAEAVVAWAEQHVRSGGR